METVSVRSHVWVWTAVLVASAAPLLGAQQAGSADKQAPGGGKPAYYEDHRLETPITVKPRGGSTGTRAFALIHEQAQVQLLMEEAWARRPLFLSVSRLPGIAVMEALEAAYEGRWHYAEPHWVLASSQESAAAVAGLAGPRLAKREGMTEYDWAIGRINSDFVQTLTPEQWLRLAGGERLKPADLAPGQWSKVRHVMRLYEQHPRGPNSNTPRPGALEGEGVLVHLGRRGDGSAGIIYIDWPGLNPADDPFWKTGMFLDWLDGAAVPEGVAQRAAARRARAASAPPAAEPPPDYHDDARFARKVPVTGREKTWALLLQALGTATEADLCAQGAWLAEAAPSRPAGWTGGTLMDEVAARQRGRWQRTGRVWVFVARR